MFDPDNFWGYALDLINQEQMDECRSRVAIGRAYYGFFLTVKHRLRTYHNVSFKDNSSDHGTAVRELQQRNRGPIAEALKSLNREREKADYRLNEEVSSEQVRFLMETATNPYSYAKTL